MDFKDGATETQGFRFVGSEGILTIGNGVTVSKTPNETEPGETANTFSKAMQEQYKVKISILDDQGNVQVAGVDRALVQACLDAIRGMCETPKIGTKYAGTVKGIKDFGTCEGFSPINLVMRSRECSRSDAVGWLQERVHAGPEIDFEGLIKTDSPPIVEERAEETEKKRKYRFQLTRFCDMRLGSEQPYLVDELIPAKGIVLLWGPPKCLKSFFTLDLMLHDAKGWEYHDRAVHKGAVIYCAFEGGFGFRKRIAAEVIRIEELEDDQLAT